MNLAAPSGFTARCGVKADQLQRDAAALPGGDKSMAFLTGRGAPNSEKADRGHA
jgi:hypothetical protein